MVDLDHHHHMESRNMDTDHDIHSSHRLIYPSPTMPMRASTLQEIKPEPGQQEFYNFLHSAPDTDIHPFNGVSQSTLQ
ncbi:hypothetical protein BDZ94DRAFT_1244057 [Collybia nuda]|uniref:Uncharacterized protein n=1 Tax=Collybia nuda TaxID=64659 RepID=A0A9P5YK14_9AGAR|nr:hypothetical protein BDZ94DRAFT_1244057 [Collybia nuda]